MVDAVEQGNRPQPTGEPSVQCVLVLTEVGCGQVGIAGFFLGQFECFFSSLGHHESALWQVVGRDAVSPPQLSADAPVLDVLHPVTVSIFVFGRIELDFVLHHRFQSDLRQVLHLQEPLHGKLRFDGHVGTLGEAHLVGIVFHLFQQSGFFQVDADLLAHVETVHAHVHPGCLANRAVVVEDVDGGQVVLLAQHVVVHVVCRCHLQAARSELDVHIVVLDDGDAAAYQRHDHLLSFQPRVLRVVRVDAHRRVAHDGFRSRGSHHGVASAFVRLAVFTGHHIFQIVQLAMFFFVNHFLVREGCQGFRIPVHHAHATVNQSFVVQVAEHLDDAFAPLLVHGESRAVPVATGPQFTQLFQDDTTVFVRPFPGIFQELFAGEVSLLDALFRQTVYHLGFGGDGSMVGTRHPTSVLAVHTGAAYEDVLNGFVEHMPHVEHARHVGGRDDYRIRFASVGFRTEKLVVEPVLVPFALYVGRIVFTC